MARSEPPPSPREQQQALPLSRDVLVAYGLPMAAFMAMTIPLSIYLMKFSVDVLLISPAAMGLILGLARLWDAITDPMAGYWSDRTHSRFGRRRVWMLGSTIPIGLTLWMIWSPPLALEGSLLVLWMAAGLLLYETASTAMIVPYGALGMELSPAYHQRTRLFAWRHVIGSIGFAFGMGFVYLLRTADDPRTDGWGIALAGGLLLLASVGFSVSRLKEPAGHQGRGGVRPRRAFADVLANPHARLLFLVYAAEAFGSASISALSPFVMQYVVKAPELLELFVASYVVPQFVFTPLWIRVARRIGKRRLWMLGTLPLAGGFGLMTQLQEGSTGLAFFLVMLIGIGSGIASVVAPAIQADVVDYDELRTGERKEGAYTAVWNFIRKAGWGVAILFTGVFLEAAGYEANAEQSASVQRTLLFLVGAVPAAGYLGGLLLLTRLRLDEAEHRAIRTALQDRSDLAARNSEARDDPS